jgi:hypothetical protein
MRPHSLQASGCCSCACQLCILSTMWLGHPPLQHALNMHILQDVVGVARTSGTTTAAMVRVQMRRVSVRGGDYHAQLGRVEDGQVARMA